jgi:hypothetical protein
MSVEHLAVVLHHSRAKGTAKLVLLGIANHEGDGGSWPSHATLAKYANVDVSNVRKALRQLASWGEVRIHVQEGGDRDCPDELRPNRYEVLVTCPAWCDRTPNHRDTRKLAGRQVGLLRRPPDRWADTPTPLGASAYRPLGASAHQTSHTNHPLQVVAQPQDVRAGTNSSPCDECSQPEYDCQRLQTKWPKDARHTYKPLRHE